MNIKYISFALCLTLVYSSAMAMQPQSQNYYVQHETIQRSTQCVTDLQTALDSLERALRPAQGNLELATIHDNIAQTQAALGTFRAIIIPELQRRQAANETHTVCPLIDALLEKLFAKLEAMQTPLTMIQHYNRNIDGNGNIPLVTLQTQHSNASLALERFFAIVNQQPAAFTSTGQSFAQCLRTTSLTKKWQLACITQTCYQRWFESAQPAITAPTAANQLPGLGEATTIRNFLMDVYMKWLIELDDIHLLVDNLACYLAPDPAQSPSPVDRFMHSAEEYATTAQHILNQGQQTTHTFTQEHLPHIQEQVITGLNQAITIGHQLQGNLQQANGVLNQIDQQTQHVGSVLNQVEGFLSNDTIEVIAGDLRYARTPYRAVGSDIVSWTTGPLRRIFRRNSNSQETSTTATDNNEEIDDNTQFYDCATEPIPEQVAIQPQPVLAAPQQVQPHQATPEQPLNEERLRRLLQSVRASLHNISQLMGALHMVEQAQPPIQTATELIERDMINLPENLLQRILPLLNNAPAHLHGLEELLITLGTYAGQLHTIILHHYTRAERFGDPHVRALLENMARTWDPEGAPQQPAPAPAPAQPNTAQHQ